ncbi:MAG: ketoacyl-ACP synthase III [Deltaproteobacteria bacterium]|nr:ketoacyl-ACP synthase III [Deltaproteobacteria bacterium]
MAIRSKILGTGHYVPERVVTNAELESLMDTTDEWIQQRTGIRERRWIDKECGASDLAKPAAEAALEMAGLEAKDIDAIIFASLSPDYNFPGSGCLMTDLLGIPGTPAVDIRNQCSGFVYGLQIADAYIRSGIYKNVLFIGSEVHSTGLDLSTRGRDVSVIFGDGAGAVLLGPSDDPSQGILTTLAGADGAYAKELWVEMPASRFIPRLTLEGMEEGRHFPRMNGREVFKHAVRKLPDAVVTALKSCELGVEDVDLFIPHQANLRIAEAVQKALGLPDEKVYNNIMHYGNTTAASIPIALDECIRSGRLQRGQLFACGAFGAGFTWGSAIIRF